MQHFLQGLARVHLDQLLPLPQGQQEAHPILGPGQQLALAWQVWQQLVQGLLWALVQV